MDQDRKGLHILSVIILHCLTIIEKDTLFKRPKMKCLCKCDTEIKGSSLL